MNQLELSLEAQPRAFTVTEIVRAAGRTLDAQFGEIWIEGEISSYRRHSSGHMYFCLKDETSQLASVLFRLEAQRLRFTPEDGLRVRCRGRLSIYEAQGKFQFYVQAMEPAGLGALQLALEQLRRKLVAEGLFDTARKRPLPKTPHTVGVVTSPSGAALRDIVRVLHRRSSVRIVVSPASVQGDGAPGSLVAALALLQKMPEVEIIILGRGGGSAEDLWAFNDETLVRAVAACKVPIISAVGHEVDFTLCDFAADVRAPTPSAAAELAVSVVAELEAELAALRLRLGRLMGRELSDRRTKLDHLQGRIQLRRVLYDRRQALDELGLRLRALHPAKRWALRRAALTELQSQLTVRVDRFLALRRHALEAAASKLDALSPLRVLDRGYAIVTRANGQALREAAEVEPGDPVDVRLHRGGLACIVKSKTDL